MTAYEFIKFLNIHPIYQTVALMFVASIPIVVLVVTGRHVLSGFRSWRDRQFKSALFSVFVIIGILLLFTGIVLVWFMYLQINPTKISFSVYIIVFTLSALLIYGAGYGLWRLAYFLDKKPRGMPPNKRMQSDKVPATRALCR